MASAHLVDVPARQEPWTAGGVRVAAGDTVSTFAVGRVYLSRPLGLWADPGTALWFRAAGPIFRGTRDTHTFTAATDGELELAVHPPGDWTDRAGEHTALPGERRLASGGLSVLVVRWGPGIDVDGVLRALAPAHRVVAGEIERRAATLPDPGDWHHLWRVGASEIYEQRGEQTLCTTERDAGIVHRDVDFPLTAATRLRWSWRVDRLPSALREDTLPTHDYLSIALLFDNGQDLTWHWSAELPPGYSYRCPLPHWRNRETHFVVRSGDADLGRWLDEERPVMADYEQAIGAPPRRIVGVWLIALSVFQRGRGECAYRGIELREGKRVERVAG